MTDQPFPTNPTAEKVNAAIDSGMKAAEDVAIKAAETAIETNIPAFNVPVLKQVEEFTVEEIVHYFGDQVSVAFQQVGTFIVIDTQVAGEKTGISKELAALMLAEKSGDQNAIQAAIVEFQKAQSALVNADGAATPHT